MLYLHARVKFPRHATSLNKENVFLFKKKFEQGVQYEPCEQNNTYECMSFFCCYFRILKHFIDIHNVF